MAFLSVQPDVSTTSAAWRLCRSCSPPMSPLQRSHQHQALPNSFSAAHQHKEQASTHSRSSCALPRRPHVRARAACMCLKPERQKPKRICATGGPPALALGCPPPASAPASAPSTPWSALELYLSVAGWGSEQRCHLAELILLACLTTSTGEGLLDGWLCGADSPWPGLEAAEPRGEVWGGVLASESAAATSLCCFCQKAWGIATRHLQRGCGTSSGGRPSPAAASQCSRG